MGIELKVRSSSLAVAASYLQPFSAKSRHEDTVLLSVEGERLTMEINDGSFAGKYNLQIEASEPIKTAMSLRLLHEIAKLAPDGTEVEMNLSVTEPCVIRAGAATYRIPPKSLPREHPTEGEIDSIVEMDGGLLSRACRLTQHAVAKKDGRTPALRGLQIDISVERFSIVGSDGRRLAVMERGRKVPKEGEQLPTGKVIIHRDFIAAFLAVIESEQQVTLIFRSRSLQVICGTRWASFPVMDGKYPPWRKAVVDEVKKQLPKRLRTTAGSFLAAVRQVQLMGGVDRQSVLVTSSEGKAFIELTTEKPNEEAAKIEIVAIEVEDFEPVRLNAGYLRESVNGIALEDEITWQFRSLSIPAVLTAGKYRAVIMPMRNDQPAAAGSSEPAKSTGSGSSASPAQLASATT